MAACCLVISHTLFSRPPLRVLFSFNSLLTFCQPNAFVICTLIYSKPKSKFHLPLPFFPFTHFLNIPTVPFHFTFSFAFNSIFDISILINNLSYSLYNNFPTFSFYISRFQEPKTISRPLKSNQIKYQMQSAMASDIN